MKVSLADAIKHVRRKMRLKKIKRIFNNDKK